MNNTKTIQICKYCESERVVKNGKVKDVQQYLCRECGHQFLDNNHYPNMQNDNHIIAVALDLYFEGLSVRKVARQLKKLYKVDIDHSSIWDWIQKYSKLVKQFTDTLPAANLGGHWHSDETQIKSKGASDPWLWVTLDRETRFMVSSHLSKTRTEKDAKALFRQAKARSKDMPKAINTDGLGQYRKAYNKVFWTRRKDTRPNFVSKVGIAGSINNNPVERVHGTLKDRTKSMRGLGSNRPRTRRKIHTIANVLGGWDAHYNFVRPHSALEGKTPSEVAGVNIELNDGWEDLIQKATKHQTMSENDKRVWDLLYYFKNKSKFQ